VDVAANINTDLATFEQLEPGVSPHFKEYLRRATYQYSVAMNKFVYKNYDSFLDFFSLDTAIQ
jgi:phytoene dehydrogenase-like protein